MNASLVPTTTDAIIAVIKDQYGQHGLSLKVPFETTIMLYESVVIAGTTHVEDIDEIVESLSFPVDVQLKRDPDNLHDK